MSNSSLGSHPSYRILKTVVGQVELLVQRVRDGAEAELDAEREQCSAYAIVVAKRLM